MTLITSDRVVVLLERFSKSCTASNHVFIELKIQVQPSRTEDTLKPVAFGWYNLSRIFIQLLYAAICRVIDDIRIRSI